MFVPRSSDTNTAVRGQRTARATAAKALESDDVAAAIDAAATRYRLLEAAGIVFAEVGFERAGVREICAKAKANVAAVKYHFGGKYALYEAAIRHWFERQERQHPLPQAPADANGEPALRMFIRTFLGRLLDHEKPAWHARLLAREMVEPTGVLDKMVAQSIVPTLAHLRGVIREIIGPGCEKVTIERAMLSVISQCVFYHHCRPILERVFPEHVNHPDIGAIAQHVGDFSVGGLRAICRSSRAAAKREARR